MDSAQSPLTNGRTTADTLCTLPRVKTSLGDEACVVHIYPSGPNMGRRYPLSHSASTIIGRSAECSIQIDDHSVSRRHARIDPTPEGYIASDLGSTNGTYVNDTPCERMILKDGDYVRVGNCIYRFLAGGNIEAEYHEEIYRLAIIDGLTEIPNKRYLMEFLNRELARSSRHSRPLSLLVFDIDHFKRINDTHGHLCGDYVLREMAHRLREGIRAEELFARYGGEEFVIVLPETELEEAIVVAERVRSLVAEGPFRFDEQMFAVTISIGVASTCGETIDPVELISKADDKLYEAKRLGRNRVVA
ncbi:MAG: GGDEF domain-containing protein [Gemmataceae bacterium]